MVTFEENVIQNKHIELNYIY